MTLHDTKYGRPLGEWAKLSEAERLADPNVGPRNIKRLNAMIAEALASTGVTTELPPPPATDGSTPAQPPADEVIPPAADPVGPAPETPPAAEPPPAVEPQETNAPPQGDGPAESDVQPADEPTKLDDDEPLIGRVIRQLPGTPVPPHVSRRPECRLTIEQASLQGRLYEVLTANGVRLRNQAEVYGWLLDQFAEVMK
jgi:hypothetical protein